MTTVQSKHFIGPLPEFCTQSMVKHAQMEGRLEAVGFVMCIPDLGIIPVRCRNIHKNPEHFFEVHHEDLAYVYNREEWIVGMYHSHPTGPPQPSEADYKYANPDLRYFIICDNVVREWDMVNRKEIL